jgi:hypothetical protein
LVSPRGRSLVLRGLRRLERKEGRWEFSDACVFMVLFYDVF